MERYYGDCADSFRDLKKEILVDLSWDIEKVFGAHVRPKYEALKSYMAEIGTSYRLKQGVKGAFPKILTVPNNWDIGVKI